MSAVILSAAAVILSAAKDLLHMAVHAKDGARRLRRTVFNAAIGNRYGSIATASPAPAHPVLRSRLHVLCALSGWIGVALATATPARAQSIASRVAAAPDGIVRMEFAARPGVCGNGRDVVAWGHTYFARNMTSIGGGWNDSRCVPGPLRVSLWITDHLPVRLETQVGSAWRSESERVTDLGVVDSREASQYFFSLVPRLETSGGKDRLLLPAVLAADAEVMKPLLAIARDEDRRVETRRSAVMWLGFVGDATVVPVLAQFARQDVDAEGDDKPGKKTIGAAATAALASVDDNAGIPALIELARDGSVGTRRNAVFWLGQNGDALGLRVLRGVIENDAEDVRVREHAIFSLSQARDASDSVSDWLVARALDDAQPMRLRRAALFWAGQREATPTADLVRIYDTARPEELREHAIFVLSQRQDDAATDALLRIARKDNDREMRGKALFWLAQKHDPRVQQLIADLILK